MAIVPLRAPRGPDAEHARPRRVEIERAPQPNTKDTKIEVGEDGLTTITIGSDQPQKRQKKRASKDDFDHNLAEDMDEAALMAIAGYLIKAVESDMEGRQDWEDTANKAADYLGIKLNDPTSAVAGDGTVCQAIATAMLEVAIKSWGTARAELLPVAGPVKVRREVLPDPSPMMGHNGGPPMPAGGDAPDVGGGIMAGQQSESDPGQPPTTGADTAGDDLAEALELDMNWYLTKGDKGYYPDFSKMLMSRALVGLAFREVFRCPIEKKPISRWVMAQDLIVQGDPAHLSSAGRVTKRAKVRPSVMRRMQVSGYYIDTTLVQPTGITSPTEITIGAVQGVTPTPGLPEDNDHTVYECCCELGSGTSHDLFGDLEMLDLDENGDDPGYPLPYRVAIDVDSRTVLAIRRNWKKGDEDHRARTRFVKYGYIPALGFYDWGLIHLVGNPTQAATMLQRSGVDAAIFANFPAWAIMQGHGSRLENTVYRPNPGEVVKVPGAAGTKINDILMAWPYKEPSPQSMALGQKLEGDVRKLGGVIEIPVGEGRIGNTPVGTIMSYIEAVSQVPGAVHKDDHIAQQEEYEMLRELLAEEPKVLWRGNKSPKRKWQVREELMSPDLIPAADPNTPSQIHRLTKVQGLVSLAGLQQFALGDQDGPIVNQRAIYHRAVEVLSGEDAESFEMPKRPPQQQAPPPDPKVVAAQINAQSNSEKIQGQLQAESLKHEDRMSEIAVESQNKDADRQSEETRAQLQLAGKKVEAGASASEAATGRAHEAGQAAADRSHEVGIAAMGHDAAATQAALSSPLVAPEGDENG